MKAALTPSVIKHLTTMPSMVKEFPFLRFAKNALREKEKKSCCGGRRRSGRASASTFETVKAAVAHLPPERIELIKKALGASDLVIRTTVNGREKTYTR